MLEPSVPNAIPNCIPDPPPLVIIDGEEEFELIVLDSKIDRKYKRCPLRYYVRWLGYEGTPLEYDWMAATELDNAQEAISEFHLANPKKPGPLESL
ncbi:hypothetical protein HGRIS_006860 [Hohenbuehelia grisea]|uniref:Chromo domain-containing protein n=1 Tax=Hohenbuehelia grisea TaxID=104357 RepID=A0ABR3JAT7_9AGAR